MAATTAFTARDSPEVVARIRRDLDQVLAEVRAEDPGLRSLVLTGGFARGEGATLEGVPQNDYDLVAIRGLSRPRTPYARLRESLTARLGLHVDLAPVAAWRLRFVAPTIFWYETALRGRVLWGPDLLGRIRVRSPADVRPTEGLRLLANRAAGLLLATGTDDAKERRREAAKALLAALDARLLSRGTFAPSVTERWALAPASLRDAWTRWAFRVKTEPDRAPEVDPAGAWARAREAVLAAVPEALSHAGLGSIDAYAKEDGVADHITYVLRTRRFARHPTGRLRVATLALLAASRDGTVPVSEAQRVLRPLVPVGRDPLGALRIAREATLP
ncbi:MAG: hypothetical protein ACT4PT_04855 [Methanobacteriota archaeon]